MKKEVLVLVGVIFALLLPFINKPFFIDDYYHFLMAKGIIENPLRPYDFLSDDAGIDNPAWEKDGFVRMVNPPLMHYYLAGVIRLLGDKELWLHLSFLVFPVLSVVAMFFLSRFFISNYFAATLLFVFSPVFLITSTGLALDSVKLTFYLLSLLFLVYGIEKNKNSLIAASGFFMGLSILTKYSAITLVPVLLIYLALNKKDWYRYTWLFAVPLFMILVWSLWNYVTYGGFHIVGAFLRRDTAHVWVKTIVIMTFISGSTIFPCGTLCFLRKRFFPVIFALIAVLTLLFGSKLGGFDWKTSLFLSFWILTTLVFFYTLLSNTTLFKNQKTKFLIAWLAIETLSLYLVMGWVAGRYFMTIIPALSMLFCIVSDGLLLTKKFTGKLYYKVIISATFVFGILLTIADFTQANVYKSISQDIASDFSGVKDAYFKADTFLGITRYMKDIGWKTASPDVMIKKDAYFLEGTIATPVYWMSNPQFEGDLKLIKIYHYETRLPVRILSVTDSAGFYATLWGALPWSISTLPLERYYLYVVK